MKTFVNPRNGDIATAKSSDPYHHIVEVKDDYGNIKDTIHYCGVTAEFVKRATADSGFIPSKGEMF